MIERWAASITPGFLFYIGGAYYTTKQSDIWHGIVWMYYLGRFCAQHYVWIDAP